MKKVTSRHSPRNARVPWPIGIKSAVTSDKHKLTYKAAKVEKDPIGQIISARIEASDGGVGTMTVAQRILVKASRALLTFAWNKKTFLSIETRVLPGHWVSFKALGEGLHLEWKIDFPRGRLLHKACPVSGRANGMKLSGIYNSVTGHSTANLAFEAWLPDDIREKLGPFREILSQMDKSAGKRATEVWQMNADPEARPIDWTKVACWGFAGMGATALGISTFGVGWIVAGGFAFGGAASICNQMSDPGGGWRGGHLDLTCLTKTPDHE